MAEPALQPLRRVALAAFVVIVALTLVSRASATREATTGEAVHATAAEPQKDPPLEPSPSTGTELRLFTPSSGGRLAAGLVVAERLEGRCFARSLASPARPDAWRCEADAAILDPCFVDTMGDPEVLACVQDPFERAVRELLLVEPLPNATPTEEPRYELAVPWALVVDGGVRCTRLTGATGGIAGLRIDYGCEDGSSLLGPIDRWGAWWRIFRQRTERRPSLERAPIEEAWF
jgi:hypothetical protein